MGGREGPRDKAGEAAHHNRVARRTGRHRAGHGLQVPQRLAVRQEQASRGTKALTWRPQMMERHFVTFYSPGTMVAEQTVKPIDSWDVEATIEMARSITERHNARPYAFRFSTRTRDEGD